MTPSARFLPYVRIQTLMAENSGLELVLASGSPRRRELLQLTGWGIRSTEVEVPEERAGQEDPLAMATRLAQAKAEAAAAHMPSNGILLTADTLVIDGEDVLGKPHDWDHARELLNRLKGKEHRVITALVLQDLSGEWSHQEVCETTVPMRAYTSSEIEAYLLSQSPFDKAGAYGIQDHPFHPVLTSQMEGCYANVMGLPLCHLSRAIQSKTGAPVQHIPQACMRFTRYTCPVYQAVLEGTL